MEDILNQYLQFQPKLQFQAPYFLIHEGYSQIISHYFGCRANFKSKETQAKYENSSSQLLFQSISLKNVIKVSSFKLPCHINGTWNGTGTELVIYRRPTVIVGYFIV